MLCGCREREQVSGKKETAEGKGEKCCKAEGKERVRAKNSWKREGQAQKAEEILRDLVKVAGGGKVEIEKLQQKVSGGRQGKTKASLLVGRPKLVMPRCGEISRNKQFKGGELPRKCRGKLQQ